MQGTLSNLKIKKYDKFRLPPLRRWQPKQNKPAQTGTITAATGTSLKGTDMPSIRTSYTDSNNFFAGHCPCELIKEYGSPLYVYNENMLRLRSREIKNLVQLPSFRVCYSAKANANPHLLKIVHSEGLHVDSMSPGELAMTAMAGFKKEEIVYVCNNVSKEEFAYAAANSSLVSVDSLSQLEYFGQAVSGGRVMVRVNPGIGAGHHKKVVTAGKETKFGINPEDFGQVHEICRKYDLTLVGLNQHIGSLFMTADAFLAAAERMLEICEDFTGLEVIDFGGGFGIPYHKYEKEARLDIEDLSHKFTTLLKNWSDTHNYTGSFIIEPGRYVPAESGLLLGTVNATKNNAGTNYVCTDVGFNILPRPMLYDSFHDIEVYRMGSSKADENPIPQTVVGNICESGDILAKDRPLPEIKTGDILGFLDAGSYCYAMASSYNQRVRPAEILITTEGKVKLIRRRESIEELKQLITPVD